MGKGKAFQEMHPSAFYHWKNLKCQEALTRAPDKSDTSQSKPAVSFPPTAELTHNNIHNEKNEVVTPLIQTPPLSLPSFTGTSGQSPDKVTCEDYKKEYDVVPGRSWGSLPLPLQK